MRAGRAIRDEARVRAAYAAPCPSCGHQTGDHRELEPTREIRRAPDGTIELVETPHPDYRPLHFHCTADGCDCVRISSAS